MVYLCRTKGRAPRLSVRGALTLLLLLVLCIDVSHELLEFGGFIFGDGRLVVVIFVVEEHGEYVCDSLALGVTHCINSCVGTFGEKLVLQRITTTVAPYNAAHLPELDVI